MTIITGPDVRVAQLLARRSALALAVKGIGPSHPSRWIPEFRADIADWTPGPSYYRTNRALLVTLDAWMTAHGIGTSLFARLARDGNEAQWWLESDKDRPRTADPLREERHSKTGAHEKDRWFNVYCHIFNER